MTRILPLLALLCLLPLGRLTAQDDELKIAVPYLPEIASAGWDFASAPWSRAASIESFSKMGGISMMGMSFQEEARPPTRVLLARDKEALYLAFDCTDPDPSQLPDQPGAEGEFPPGDRIELYLEGDQGSRQGYYHLAFDPAGTRWQALGHNRIETGAWSVKSQREADRWKAIVRIPFATLGLTGKEEITRGIFYRMFRPQPQGEAEGRVQSTWGGRGVHQSAQFGTLELEPVTP